MLPTGINSPPRYVLPYAACAGMAGGALGSGPITNALEARAKSLLVCVDAVRPENEVADDESAKPEKDDELADALMLQDDDTVARLFDAALDACGDDMEELLDDVDMEELLVCVAASRSENDDCTAPAPA